MDRLALSLVTGLWGAATMAAIAGQPGRDPSLIIMALVGASLAGLATGPLFRQSMPWPVLAAALATTLGAALAGALALGANDFPASLVLGPALVWAAIVESPTVLMVWVAGLAATGLTAHSLK